MWARMYHRYLAFQSLLGTCKSSCGSKGMNLNPPLLPLLDYANHVIRSFGLSQPTTSLSSKVWLTAYPVLYPYYIFLSLLSVIDFSKKTLIYHKIFTYSLCAHQALTLPSPAIHFTFIKYSLYLHQVLTLLSLWKSSQRFYIKLFRSCG